MKTPTLLLSALASLAPLLAQDRPLKTKLLPVGVAGAVSELYFRNDGKPAELKASMTGLGAGIDYTGPARLALYASEEALNPPAEGEKPPQPLTVVTLPEGADRVLLVIAPPPKDQKGPAIRAYPVSTGDLSSGDYRFFNFSPDSTAIVLGEKRVGLKPGDISTVTSAEWKRETVDLPVKIGLPTDSGSLRMVYSSVWGHQPAQRNFILIFKGTSAARPLDVRRFYDVPGASPQEDDTRQR